MKHLPTVATTMTPFPHAIDVNDSLTVAQAMMLEYGFHHLPVTEGGQVVGILSETELRFVASPFSGRGADPDMLVKDICNTRVFSIDIHDRLDMVVSVMAEKHLDAAIVTRMGKLAGILTASDALRKFAEVLEGLRPPSGGGEAA